MKHRRGLLSHLTLAASFVCGSAFAQGAPPGGSAKPTPAKPDKAKPDKPKDDKKPAEAELATEVLVIHATNSGKGIDPRIGNMPELGWRYGYAFFWVLVVLVVAGLLWWLKRKRWI